MWVVVLLNGDFSGWRTEGSRVRFGFIQVGIPNFRALLGGVEVEPRDGVTARLNPSAGLFLISGV